MIRSALIATFLLTSSAPAMASEPPLPTTAPAKAAVSDDDRNKISCHKETYLGSHIPRQVCDTKADAEARSQDAQRMTNRLQSFGFNCQVKGC